MAIISFSNKPEESWVVAGWAVRQVLDDVMVHCAYDKELTYEFNQAKLRGGLLNVDLLDPNVAERATAAIREVVEGMLAGSVRSGILNQESVDNATQSEYRKGLEELREAIPKPKSSML